MNIINNRVTHFRYVGDNLVGDAAVSETVWTDDPFADTIGDALALIDVETEPLP